MGNNDITDNYAKRKEKEHKKEIKFIRDTINLLQKQARLEEKINDKEKERSSIIIDSEKNIEKLKSEMIKIRSEVAKTTKDYNKLVGLTADLMQQIARTTKATKGGLNVFSGAPEDAYKVFKQMTEGLNKAIDKGAKSFEGLAKNVPTIANTIKASLNDMRLASDKTAKEIEKAYTKTHVLLSSDVQDVLLKLKEMGKRDNTRTVQRQFGVAVASKVSQETKVIAKVNEMLKEKDAVIITRTELAALMGKGKDYTPKGHYYPPPPSHRPPPIGLPSRKLIPPPDIVTGQGVEARLLSTVQRSYIRDRSGGGGFNISNEAKVIKKLMGDKDESKYLQKGDKWISRIDASYGLSQSTALKEHLSDLKSGNARIQALHAKNGTPDFNEGRKNFDPNRSRAAGIRGQYELEMQFREMYAQMDPSFPAIYRGNISRDSKFGRLRNRMGTTINRMLPERRFREEDERERAARRVERRKKFGSFATKALGGSLLDSRIRSKYPFEGDPSRKQKLAIGGMRAINFAAQAGALIAQKALSAGGEKSIASRVGSAREYIQNVREELGTEVVGQKAVYERDEKGRITGVGYEDITQKRVVTRGELAGGLVKRGVKKALPLAGAGMAALGKGLFSVFGKVASIMKPLAIIIEPLSEVLGAFGEIIGTAFIPLLQEILGLLFSEDMMAAMNVVVEALTQVVTLIVDSGLLDLIADVLVFALKSMSDLLSNEGFKSALKMLIEALMTIVNEVFKVLQPILPAIMPLLVIFAQLIGILAKILAGLVQLLMPLIMVIIGLVINTIIAVINGIINFVNIFLPKDKDIATIGYMPMSLDKQGVVEQSGIAKVHKGEYVVKKEIMTEIMNETVVNNQFYGDYDNMARLSYEDSLMNVYSRRRR